MDMTLPDNEPTRKQRFDAALKLAGLTAKQWTTEHCQVEASYLHRVLTGEYPGGPELNAAIDAVIEKYLTATLVAVPRGTVDLDAA